MSYASVRAAAQEAAKRGVLTPHQLAALSKLDESLTTEQKAEFTAGWRAAGSPAAPLADVANSWEGIRDAAASVGCRYCDLAAAQWALESGWGKYTSGKNNVLGLKGKGSATRTKEYVEGQWVEIVADFLDFRSVRACVEYLVERWYKDWKHYKGVDSAPDRNAAARMLVSQGYATAPDYADKLIKLMDRHAPVAAASSPACFPNPLSVPFYAQMDSDLNQPSRMCFSSSCAMLLAFLKPGVLTGANGDDQYLRRVLNYGDTTDPKAQVHALNSYGVKARFTKTADFDDLEDQIARGIPVPCGYLHRGPVSNPSGGGHWLCVVGIKTSAVIVHDPFGEADLVRGTTLNRPARFAEYSRKNWGPRWMVEGEASGWAILAEA